MQKKYFYISAFFIVILSCDRTAEQYYNSASELGEQGNYIEAIELLDQAIEKNPNLRPALLDRGVNKSLLGNYQGAIADYEDLLKSHPDNTLALVNIGHNYKRLELYEKAINYYSKALKTKGAIPSDTIYIEIQDKWDKDSYYYLRQNEILFERGVSYVKNQDYNLAIMDFREVTNYNYRKGSAFAWMGESYLKLKDTATAKQYLVKAKEMGILESEELLKKISDH